MSLQGDQAFLNTAKHPETCKQNLLALLKPNFSPSLLFPGVGPEQKSGRVPVFGPGSCWRLLRVGGEYFSCIFHALDCSSAADFTRRQKPTLEPAEVSRDYVRIAVSRR